MKQKSTVYGLRSVCSALTAAAMFFSGIAICPAQTAEVGTTEGALEEEVPTVTINVQDTDIRAVITAFSRQTGKSVVIGPAVSNTVTLILNEQPWPDALEVMLRPYGYGYQEVGDTLIINKLDKIRQVETVEPLQTKVFKLRYVDAHDIESVIKKQLSPRGKVSVVKVSGQKGWAFGSSSGGSSRSGSAMQKLKREGKDEQMIKSKTLVVTDIRSSLDRIAEMLIEVDIAPVQILIEARFVEVNSDFLKDIGIDFGTGVGGASSPGVKPITQSSGNDVYGIGVQSIGNQVTPYSHGPLSSDPSAVLPFNTGLTVAFQQLSGKQFEVLLHMLEEDVSANTLSAPRILTLDNQEATIIVGSKFPILSQEVTTEGVVSTDLDYYENIGIQLNVVPQVANNDSINLIVHPAVTDQIGTTSGKTGTDSNILLTDYPILSTRETETQILLKSGETVVIGGMLEERESTTTMKVPILGYIPLLGKLFTRTTHDTRKMDLLIFITATIVDGDTPPAPVAEAADDVAQTPPPTPAQMEAQVEAVRQQDEADMRARENAVLEKLRETAAELDAFEQNIEEARERNDELLQSAGEQTETLAQSAGVNMP